MSIDDILKKSISGSKIQTKFSTSSVDDILKASRSGEESQDFNTFRKPAVEPVVEPPKKSGLNKALNFIGKGVKLVTVDLNPLVPGSMFERGTREIIEPIVEKAFDTKAGKAITGKTYELSTDLNLKFMSAVEAARTDVTYDQAMKNWQTAKQNPDNPVWKDFLYNLGSSGPQSLIGVALSFVPVVGKPLSYSYFAAISAEDQRLSRGKVSSIGNIAIDVAGDQMLGSSLEGLFKSGKKSLIKAIAQSAFIEGSTEVSQTILKYGNDYRNAKTKEDRDKIIAEAKNYIKSGDILMELTVGAAAGGVVGGGAQIISGKGGTPTVNIIEEKKSLYDEAVKVVPSIPKGMSKEEWIKGQGETTIPKELETLANEAKKYKTSKEFITAMRNRVENDKTFGNLYERYQDNFNLSQKAKPSALPDESAKGFVMPNFSGIDIKLKDFEINYPFADRAKILKNKETGEILFYLNPKTDLNKLPKKLVSLMEYSDKSYNKKPYFITQDGGKTWKTLETQTLDNSQLDKLAESDLTDLYNKVFKTRSQLSAQYDEAVKEPTAPIAPSIPQGISKYDEEIQYKVEQAIPAIENAIATGDEHLVETVKTLAEQSGDKTLVAKVNEAIAVGEKSIKESQVTQDKLNTVIEQSKPKVKEQKIAQESSPKEKAPVRRAPTITHYTLPENVNSIIENGFDTSKPPIFGTGSLEGGTKTGKAASDVLYFTTDNSRWSSAEVYVGEGKGDISREVYDYNKQSWVEETNAYKKVDLAPVEAKIAKDTKIMEVDTLPKAKQAIKDSGQNFDKYNMIQQLVTAGRQFGYDIVNIKNPGKGEWSDGTTDKFGNTDLYKTLTGNSGNSDYFVLNKKAIELPEPPSKIEGKKKITVTSEEVTAENKNTVKIKGEEVKRPEQFVTKTQLKEMLKGIDQKTVEMEVVEKDGKLMMKYDDGKNSILMRPYSLGLVETNIEVGDTIEIRTDDLKAKGTALRGVSSSGETLANLASPQGSKTIRKIIEKQNEAKIGDVQEVPKDFKISERAKAILEKFGVSVAERTLSSRYLGVYKPLTQKVRVQALYDITTVTHEGIHAIDDQVKFSEKLIKSTGRGAEIRNRLTDIYEALYPKAKRTHKLETRIKEGLAVLFENFFYDPASIQAEYGDLVDAFIKPDGKYYHPQFTELLDDMNSLVDDYAKLTPEQRIGSRIRTGKEVVERQTGFTFKQRLEYEMLNRFEPIKRYGKLGGVEGTWDDPYIQAFNILNKNSIIGNWLKGNNRAILLKDGNFRIEKGSVSDYIKMIKGKEDAFRSFLVARRVVEMYNKATALKNYTEELNNFTGELGSSQLDEGIQAASELKKLQSTIKRDDFSLQDATAVVEKYADEFTNAVELYDNINKDLIDLAEQHGMISHDAAELYRGEKGYTSFSRFIDEELASIGTIKSSSKSKITSFKERTGSQLDIIDPIYNQINAINEVMGKAFENRLWLKVSDLANKFPEISQRFEKIDAVPSIDAEGNITFPQEKDPGVIRIFRNGKREFYKIAPEFGAVVKQLRGKELDLFAQILRIPTATFTRLVTSANPVFAVGNIIVDQFSALGQTETGFVPIVDPAKSFYKYITGDKGMAAYRAMGGDKQNLAGFFELSPDQIAHKLAGGETKLEKFAGVVESGLHILEMPSNLSELGTRFSEFNNSINQGDSMSVAMYKAAEVTTPFALQGNFGGRMGQEYIKSMGFLNATFQVLYKFGRATVKHPERIGTLIAALTAVGLTSAILTYKYGTDEQKRLLAEQPVANGSKYLYFPNPNGRDLIKIKVPQEMGVFTGLGYLFVAEHYGKNKVSFDDYVSVVDSVLPDQVTPWEPKKWAMSLLPQVIKPTIEVVSNTKTFPNVMPIVPPYMVDRAPKEQYNAYTSRTSKFIAGLIGSSPTKTEFWISNQFGTVGGELIGKFPGNPINIQEKQYVMTGRSYQRFYDNRTLVQQQYDEIITNDKGDNQKYTYEQKYAVKEEHATYESMSKMLTRMRDINKTVDIPDTIKSQAYDLLLKIDSTQNINDITPELYKLNDALSTVESAPAPEKKKTSLLNDLLGVKTASAAEFPAPAVNKTTFLHQNKSAGIDEVKKQVAFRESGIVSAKGKDPYKAVGPTKDLGKYQVSPDTLAGNSKRFLGKEMTPEQFLNSPADQEKFFEKTMEKFQTSFGVKNLDTAMVLWHRGFGDISASRITKLKKSPEMIKYLANQPKS